ncbi:hypothetical protein EIP91_005925 [Steccherinum ochraceum]|uniref:N-acetyltransferase domain-containing protein n=1 Tax=Steccherinum ochraceum TaxID=92696 RepID=A0A4R0RZC1_9APHY|nr:hypothetical protein EIP91_005925 [Steccherinum ochraceum]
MSLRSRMKTSQEKKRGADFVGKLKGALDEVLGPDRSKKMSFLSHIATTPAKQGRGYGSALCAAMAKEADARGLPSYVISSNVDGNTRFYNSNGYFTVKEIIVGDTDPTWEKEPVKIAI